MNDSYAGKLAKNIVLECPYRQVETIYNIGTRSHDSMYLHTTTQCVRSTTLRARDGVDESESSELEFYRPGRPSVVRRAALQQ